MASEAEVAEVRANTAQPDDVAPYTDDYINGLIDAGSVTSATLSIWRSKAANYASLVDVQEAGASHKFSDLFKHANDMIKIWSTALAEEDAAASGYPVVNEIVRE